MIVLVGSTYTVKGCSQGQILGFPMNNLEFEGGGGRPWEAVLGMVPYKRAMLASMFVFRMNQR